LDTSLPARTLKPILGQTSVQNIEVMMRTRTVAKNNQSIITVKKIEARCTRAFLVLARDIGLSEQRCVFIVYDTVKVHVASQPREVIGVCF